MTTALALACALTLTANDPRLLQAQKFLEARDCEALEALFKNPSSKEPGTQLAYARVLVQGATICREKDKVLALNLTESARKLAPQDYGVLTAYAESLIATEQRTEGSQLLDQLIQQHPDTATRARMLRAQLAVEEREWAVAVQIAKPLVADPEYGEQAKKLVDEAEKGAADAAGEKEKLTQDEARVRKNAETAQSVATSHTSAKGHQASGYEVWTAKSAKVTLGSHKSFSTKGLKAGTSYVFVASGKCEKPKQSASRGGRRRRQRAGPITNDFGVNFKVYIGSLEPMAIDTDLGEPRRNTLLFRPVEDNPQIRVQDETDSKVNVKCTISDIAVRNP